MPAEGHGLPLRLGFIAAPNSVHTRRWVGWFARAGHDVHLLDPFGATVEPGIPPGVQVHRLDLPTGPPVLGLARRGRALAAAMERIGIQLLHAQFVRRYGWQAALSGFHPLVMSPWGSDLLRVRRRAIRTRWWNRYALRSADLVTVSSEEMRLAAVRAGAAPRRIALVHHGVDTRRFVPRVRRTDGAPRILSLRATAPLYHHETVIDAVAMISDASFRPSLVMTRLGGDPTYLAALHERASNRGIAGQLELLDAVPHDDLPDLFRGGDVLVSIPESDSFPVTLLEGMASGLPAVVSDLPAVRPVYGALDPLAEELIVPVGDVAATAVALRRALDLSAAERARLGQRLRAHVVATADYNTHMARMEGLYRGLIAR